MAEFVEKRCQDGITEVQQIKRIKLFDRNQIRYITEKFKEYDRKMQPKCKEGYLRYIQYEKGLLKLFQKWRNQFGVTQTKSNLDFIILNKINNLYKEAISKFQNDIRFWNAYIDFSKHHFPNNISHILHRMVQVHRDKPKCWQIAACWELAMNNNKPNARQYLLRGLLIHPDSQLLYIDAFKLELDDRLATASTNAENAESQEDNSASVMMNDTEMPLSLERAYFIYQQAYDRMNDTGMPLSLERAYFIYQQASDRIKDIKFIIQLINIANEYNDTDKLQKNIIEEMLDKYIEEPLMWDYLARRELQDLMRPLLTPTELENAKHMSLRKRIMCCNQVYQIAMEKIKTKKMWTLYIDCLWEINRDGRSLPNFRRNLLNRALKKAHQAKKLKQGHYLSWIEMLISEIQRETESEEGNTETLNDNRKREGARKQLEELLCGAIEAVDI